MAIKKGSSGGLVSDLRIQPGTGSVYAPSNGVQSTGPEIANGGTKTPATTPTNPFVPKSFINASFFNAEANDSLVASVPIPILSGYSSYFEVDDSINFLAQNSFYPLQASVAYTDGNDTLLATTGLASNLLQAVTAYTEGNDSLLSTTGLVSNPLLAVLTMPEVSDTVSSTVSLINRPITASATYAEALDTVVGASGFILPPVAAATYAEASDQLVSASTVSGLAIITASVANTGESDQLVSTSTISGSLITAAVVNTGESDALLASSTIGAPGQTVFTMTQLADNKRVYQRSTTTGGSQSKGSGSIPVTVTISLAGPLYARIRSTDGTTILQPSWKVANATVGANQTFNITGIDARLGWFYIDLSGDNATWTLGTTAVGMGDVMFGSGQSLMVGMITGSGTTTTETTPIASRNITVSPYGVVSATWNALGDALSNPTWEVPSDTGRYKSTYAAERLRLEVAARGVNMAFVGFASTATSITRFLPDGDQSTALRATMARVGGWSEFIWFQGHQDTTLSDATYRANLLTLFNDITAYNTVLGSNYDIMITTIPNMGTNASYTGFNTINRPRRGAIDFCRIYGRSYKSATYVDMRDIELQADLINPNSDGNVTIARHYYRAARGNRGLATTNIGPTMVSATRASGSQNINITVRHQPGTTNLTVNGNPGQRFGVYAWNTYTNVGTAIALDATTPFAIVNNGNGTSTITLKLASVPLNTDAFDIYWDPYPTSVADGSANMIYDDVVDSDGITRGRPLTPMTYPLAVYAPAVAAPVNTVAPVQNGVIRPYLTAEIAAGTWSNTPVYYDYEFLWNDNSTIQKYKSNYYQTATTSSCLVDPADFNHVGQWKVTAYNAGGATTAYSGVYPVADYKRGPDLVTSGSITYVPDTGSFGQVMKGAATAYLASLTTSDVLPASNTWTMEFFFKTATTPQFSSNVIVGSGNKARIGINTSGQLYATIQAVSTSYTVTSAATYTDGLRHHVRLVSSPTGIIFYADGVIIAQNTVTSTSGAGNSVFYFGGISTANTYTDTIDEFASWNIALPNGTPPTGPYAGTETDLRALYHFNGDAKAGGPSLSFTPVSTYTEANDILSSTASGNFAVISPSYAVAPTISGSSVVGSTLTVSVGTWTNNPTFTYQWKAAGVNISGATGNSYVTQSGDLGKAITCVVTGTNTAGSASATSNSIAVVSAPLFTTLNADGYSTQGSVAMSSNTALTVTRQGFDTTGNPITFNETIYSYGPYFQMPPTLALSSSVSVLSDTMFSTDSIPGVVNNNPDAPPKGVLRWQQSDQRIVGNVLSGSIVGYHIGARNGKPFACVKVFATDGVNTSSITLTDCTVNTDDPNRDKTAVWEYNYSLDISGLNAGDITLNAEAYPWIGNASSVAKSATGIQGQRGFVPQLYTRNPAANSYGAVNYVYIATGGNDTTGYVGPDYNLAKASPCATPMGARLRADVVLGTATGACNGLAFVLSAGTWEFTSVTSTRTTTRDAIITRDPTVPRSSVIFQFATANDNSPVTNIYIYDVTMKRNGVNQLKYARVTMRNVDLDTNNNGVTPFYVGAIIRIEGGSTVINNNTTVLYPSGTSNMRLCRGLTASNISIEADNVVGCSFSGASSVGFVYNGVDNQYDNFVIYSNIFSSITTEVFNCNLTTNGGFFGNNLIEWISGTSDSIGFSRDGGKANLTNVHVIHNTVTGAGASGRINMFYDETAATPRTHKYNSVQNNIFASINHKNVWFLYQTSGFNDFRTGALETFHGANHSGNFSQFGDAAGQAWFRPYYFGKNSNISMSLTTRNDALFTNYQGQTNSGSTMVNGVGGGTYTLQSGSPCRNAAFKKLLPGGINGVAFAASPNMGAYG